VANKIPFPAMARGSTFRRPAIRRFAPPVRNTKPAKVGSEDRIGTIIIDLAIIVGLFICFGSIGALVMKVQHLKQAPSWMIALYLPPIAISAVAIALRPHIALRTALMGGPYFLLVLWCVASFQWSNQPALTLRQALLMSATYATACMIAQNLSWVRVGRILTGLFTTQAVISAGLALFKPEWGVMTEIYPGSWAGIWGFKQTLGIAMAVGAGCTSGYMLMRPKAWVWCVPALMVMLLCVVKSQATTAILVSGFAIAVPFAVWLAQRNQAASVFVTWAVLTAAVSIALIVTVLAPIIFHALGKAPTLTGRTDIWAALEGALQARPLLGWGYQAFWTDVSVTSPVETIVEAMDGFRPPDAHSTPIDLRLQLGYVGFVLAFIAFARTWFQAFWQSGNEPSMMIVVGILVALTSICFTEAIGLYPMDSMTLVIQIIVVKTALTMWDRKDQLQGRAELV
jgi:exopolysaccharide production protein ExoQ